MQRLLLPVTLLAALLLLLLSTSAQDTTSTNLIDERIERATVFILQARNTGSDLIVSCVGSGTLVSRDGLILANAHNTVQSSDCPGDTIIIAMNIQPGEPPIPKYRAEVAQANVGIDLAVLRISRELDGRLIDTSTLALPFVELADSSTVNLDNTIFIVGYPGIGEDAVTTIRGTVSGFTAEPSGGDKSWIKTEASIAGTMSGGGAYNSDGRLIGIPTTAPITSSTPNAVCQSIQDTNRDGLVNDLDTCIPVGVFINSLRPANFARPLLRAARLGLLIELPGAAPQALDGAPDFDGFFFAPAVTDGMPTTVIGRLPAGATALYMFFRYRNMTPETVYELRVTRDGIPDPTFSLAPVRWSGGTRGLWHVGSSGQPWPNGIYEFTLFINGIATGTSQITVGGAATPAPTFSNIVFGLTSDQESEAVYGNGYVLPTGNIASARFIYQNIPEGMTWFALWYYNDGEVFRSEGTWNTSIDGTNGAKIISIAPTDGLFPGMYRLELYIEGRLAALAQFTVAGAREGAFPRIFTDAHFTSAENAADAINAPALNNFTTGVDRIYALFNWEQITPGTLWTMRWTVDNDVFLEQTVPWSGSSNGTDYLVRLSAANGIPDGTYRMELLINNIPLAATQASVGIGQLPIDRFATASGVQLNGLILDADTRTGIAGATIMIISEDFAIEDFIWQASQLYATAVTDRNGRFQLQRPLQIGDPAIFYSVYVIAEGYLPVTADGFAVDADETPNPLEIVLPLTRD